MNWASDIAVRYFTILPVSLSLSFLCVARLGPTLQRTNPKNSKQILPEKELRGHSPNFHMHVSVSDLYISNIDLPILLQDILVCGPILAT